MKVLNLYRFRDFRTEIGVNVHLFVYPVLSTTPKGYWIYADGSRKWVSMTAKKRFAHPTRSEAVTSYKKRKDRQIAILQDKLNAAQLARHHDIRSVQTMVG